MGWQEIVGAMDAAVIGVFKGNAPTTYQPQGGTAVPVNGIFDAAYVRVGHHEMAGVESSGPAVFYRLADLPANPDTDTPLITINGIAYSVIESKPDGQGGVMLILHKN